MLILLIANWVELRFDHVIKHLPIGPQWLIFQCPACYITLPLCQSMAFKVQPGKCNHWLHSDFVYAKVNLHLIHECG